MILKRSQIIIFALCILFALVFAGCTAERGRLGPQGVNGTPGVPGPMGPGGGIMNQTANMTANTTAGPPSANGADGAAATIAVGTVVTGFPSSVTNVGTAAAAIFNFVLEQGIQGPTGLMNQTFNLTANMTAGPQGLPGTGINNLTAGLNMSAIVILGDNAGKTNLSIRNASNGQVAYIDSLGNAFFNTSAGSISTNLSAVYPIGSVYISTLSTDPKITFEGFGCWTKINTGYSIVSV